MVGYGAQNINIFDPIFICSVCLLLLRVPVQLRACGHRQCQSCVNTQRRTKIKCAQCSSESSHDQLMQDRGFNNDMQSLSVDCSFCQWTGILNNYQEHLDQIHRDPKCDYCDKQFNSVNKLNEHKVWECQKVIINCPLKDFGCNEQVMRSEMKEHYLSEKHQEVILKIISQMTRPLQDSQMVTNTSLTTTTTNNNPATVQLQKIYETLNILANGIRMLIINTHQLSNDVCQLQVTLQNLSDLLPCKIGVPESGNSPQAQQINMNQHQLSMTETIDNVQTNAFDGTCIWKITNVEEKMNDAQSERQTSIYSPVFYSSPTGYKMRARLYLFGDDEARRTHMSLFFVLMRGEYDPILKFPFNYKVTFCLFDQTLAQTHIIESFRPDIKSNSFQRPRSDMNIASGIPKFFPLTMIRQEGNPYVRDDTMFIKIMVDFGEMPKTLLPYALSLNPGLPTFVQQALIKQEAERRDQPEQ